MQWAFPGGLTSLRRLLFGPSQFLLIFALLVTWSAKYLSLQLLVSSGTWVDWLSPWPMDLAVYVGLGTLAALAESRWRPAIWLTGALSLVLCLLGIANALYLVGAGEQGNWGAVKDLFERFVEGVDVVEENTTTVDMVVAVICTTAAVWLWWRTIRKVRATPNDAWRSQSRASARTGASITVVCLLMAWLMPQPSNIGGQKLATNALATIGRTYVERMHPGNFEGWDRGPVVSKQALASFAQRRNRPNVFMVILESTRWDHSRLSGPHAKAEMPVLESLAQRGLLAAHTRSVLPHTTKSMFSALCGRYPTMQRSTIELSADIEYTCLPELLTQSGYATSFFQSSWGTFESRPRLVSRFGYGHFAAWEDIQGHRLGYLASDDESMVDPVMDWIDAQHEHELEDGTKRPFMITVLTSAAHHPYRLPPTARLHARQNERPMATPAERYARLVEAEDRMLGRMLDELEVRELLDDTIVIVFGDHGEGFGTYGVKQHDHNFYEEGLRVPLVISGPGVSAQRLEHNTSLIDVMPTLMGLLELPAAAPDRLDGHDLLAPDYPKDDAKFFGCYSHTRCQGFVKGREKVVRSIGAGETWYFDLESDPLELSPLPLPERLEGLNHELTELMREHRIRGHDIEYAKLYDFKPWRCYAGKYRCKHPKAHKKKYRYKTKRSSRSKRAKKPRKPSAAKKTAPAAKASEKGAGEDPAAPGKKLPARSGAAEAPAGPAPSAKRATRNDAAD